MRHPCQALPCGDNGNELAFTVQGALGAETNPGFSSAVTMSGSVRVSETGTPPDDVIEDEN